MNQKEKIIYSLGAIAIFLLVKASDLANNLSFSFVDIKLTGTLLNPRAVAIFQVQNPSSFNIKIDNGNGEILYNDVKVAAVNVSKAVVIPKNDSANFEINIDSKIKEVIIIFKALISNDYLNKVSFKGVVNVAGVPISINKIIA
jgi:LEA14-like dessication related protein